MWPPSVCCSSPSSCGSSARRLASGVSSCACIGRRSISEVADQIYTPLSGERFPLLSVGVPRCFPSRRGGSTLLGAHRVVRCPAHTRCALWRFFVTETHLRSSTGICPTRVSQRFASQVSLCSEMHTVHQTVWCICVTCAFVNLWSHLGSSPWLRSSTWRVRIRLPKYTTARSGKSFACKRGGDAGAPRGERTAPGSTAGQRLARSSGPQLCLYGAHR